MILVCNLGDVSETAGIVLKFSRLVVGTDSHGGVGTFQFVFSLSQFPALLNLGKGISINTSSLILVPHFQANEAATEKL